MRDSRLSQRPTVGVNVSIQFTEQEMRALDALAGYGADAFLEIFYAHLGRKYLEPHEAGLRSLFDTVRTELPPILKRADAARTAFMLRNPVIRSKEDHDALVARVREQTRQEVAHG